MPKPGNHYPHPYNQQVYALVRAIPPGRVMTYGGIAALIAAPPGIAWENYVHVRARWVGYAMAACPDDVPWQRVVNARGGISPRPNLGAHMQRSLLEQEGVHFAENGRIDLDQYSWQPPEAWLRQHGFLLPMR
jgi:methylated-DNA-protein-cysteine methyltransferase-like protein